MALGHRISAVCIQRVRLPLEKSLEIRAQPCVWLFCIHADRSFRPRSRNRRDGLKTCQRIALGCEFTVFKKQFNDPARVLRADFVLHFHGFQNEQQIPRVDEVAGPDQPADNPGLQGGANFGHRITFLLFCRSCTVFEQAAQLCPFSAKGEQAQERAASNL